MHTSWIFYEVQFLPTHFIFTKLVIESSSGKFYHGVILGNTEQHKK